MRAAVLLIVIAGCGRIAFDRLAGTGSGADGDGGMRDTSTSAVDALPVCNASYDLVGFGSRYRRSTSLADWFGAEANCEADGGHLVVIDSSAENAFVASSGLIQWLGASDHLLEGQFRNVTGTLSPTNLWAGAEPNNSMNSEDCVHVLDASGAWNDVDCLSGTIDYVCECDGTVAAATSCDTSQDTDCGQCGTSCMAALICMNQICS